MQDHNRKDCLYGRNTGSRIPDGEGANWGAGKLKNLASKALPKLKTAVKENAGKLANKVSNAFSGFSKKTPNWKGSGPARGVLGINRNSRSNKAIKNYYPRSMIEFVFDAKTDTFVVGENKDSVEFLSAHQKLAESINADQGANTTLGGTFSRGENGEIYTTEDSGHFGKNWTDDLRIHFQNVMKKYGLEVKHGRWKQ